MTKIDNEFIFFYTENARSKIKNIASFLKKSSQRLKYNIGQLEKEGYLEGSYTIFDYSFFGVLLFRVYFKGGYISEKNKQETILKLKENPYVMAIYELTGEFDLCVEIGAPNPSRFKKELKKVAETVPALNNYKIILNVVTHLHPRNYLLKGEVPHGYVRMDTVIGGDRSPIQFDEDEFRVMKCILENPKMRLTFIAKKCELNVKTVVSILKKLFDNKVIRGYKYLLNVEKLNVSRHRIFLSLHNVSEEREEQMMQFLDEKKEVVLLHKTVGDWDMEFDVESESREKVKQIIALLREDFKDMIQSFNIIELNKFHLRRYLPGYVFEKESQ